MWTLVYFLAFFQYICRFKCWGNAKLLKNRPLLVYTCAAKKPFSIKLCWNQSYTMTSARHANIHIISVTNGWWSEKTRQKWENRTLYWVIYPEFKRQWLSKAGMNKCNSSLFFSVQIFDSTQQSSFIVAIKNKPKYSQHPCFVPKIHEGIFNRIDQSLSQAYLINFWISLKLSKGVDTPTLLWLLFKMWL